jgi:hypothetical protein
MLQPFHHYLYRHLTIVGFLLWYSKRAAAENEKKRLSRTEKQQLLSEVLLLESYNKSKPEVVQGRGQHGKF